MELSVAHKFLNLIESARTRSAHPEQVVINPAQLYVALFSGEEFVQCLRYLALRGLLTFEVKAVAFNMNSYLITLLPGYDEYFESIQNQYLGRVPVLEEKAQDEEESALPQAQGATVFIRFDALNRYILLNDCFLIAQPAYDSENYRFFEYVWKHPNRNITLEELNQNLAAPLIKPIAKTLENLNFRGSLKDAFFQVSKTSILFTPNRTVEALTDAGLYPLRLFSVQKTIKQS